MNRSIATIVMAAGRGSRMKAYDGNKTLLPLIPGASPFDGQKPILCHILKTLPEGPKALIVNYRQEDIKKATRDFEVSYCYQPVLNGTGGALLAARDFLAGISCDSLLITMGDVPFVQAGTFMKLIEKLKDYPLVCLGFIPEDKKQYGLLEIENNQVRQITEWKYWREYAEEKQAELTVSNAGIYAARRETLLRYLSILESRPQIVQKEKNGRMVEIEEFFLTDIVEYMNADGLAVGCGLTDHEMETMGVDDPSALERAQAYYAENY